MLIPCYNNVEGLIASLKSVNYYRGLYLVVVVDDGSNEPIHITYDDVIVLRNEDNLGITAAINKGLQWILNNTRAKYIARLDCGDICDFNRFFRQVTFLHEHNNVGLVGSWCRFSAKDENYYKECRRTDRILGWHRHEYAAQPGSYVYRTPAMESAIRREMYNRNVFIHPTVMFKREAAESIGEYPDKFPFAEDYAYFWMIMNKFPVAILSEVLVTCEINKGGLSYSNKRKQFVGRWRVVAHFGTNRWRKLAGCLRLAMVFLLPKRLSLFLKSQK